LLERNFPLIHAVGRASARPPCLADLAWGKPSDPKVTLVGKGICFDSGGLDIKPPPAMALMKKDMGGAASVMALGAMIMAAKLPVRLRILIPAADNAISGSAFRPGDIIKSRAGITVEIANTDAEGRLVLADALALADDDAPDLLIDMATLTGAARVALGPELTPFYTDDETLAADLAAAGLSVADPVWRMPFWAPYDEYLKSKVADVNHIYDSPFAGSITAALFLKRFVKKAKRYAHLDIYAWTPRAAPGKPVGGEPQGARALFEAIQTAYGRRRV
jgi:leucyl aminopeptidase